jgi:phosphatidylinositol glycan class C protein
VLSINAAISSSVVLASRLADDLGVFALMLFAVQAFALFPTLRHRLQASASTSLQALLTLILCSIAVASVASLSTVATALFAAVFLSVTFIAPAMLVWAQKYKNEIRGPWDVAIPKVT